MPSKRPYTVVEVGPGYSFEPSPVLLNHVNNLPHERIAYFALDPLYHTPIGNQRGVPKIKRKILQAVAKVSRKPFGVEAVKKTARQGVDVHFVKHSASDDFPFRGKSVDELHAHSLLIPRQFGGPKPNPEAFLQRVHAVLKRDGKLYLSGSPGNAFFELTSQTAEWFKKRGFSVDKRIYGPGTARFSRFKPTKLITLRKK